jgi:Co/Zn/Cd efflux system component
VVEFACGAANNSIGLLSDACHMVGLCVPAHDVL